MKLLKHKLSIRQIFTLLTLLIFISIIHQFLIVKMFSILRDVHEFNRNPLRKLRDFQRRVTKNILVWSGEDYLWVQEKGRPSVFTALNCPIKECAYHSKTSNRTQELISLFDAIIFTPKDLRNRSDKPRFRLNRQVYIFVCLEPSATAPVCEPFADNLFNWTLTYKLDSTIPWTHLIVRNKTGEIIAPTLNVSWIDTSKEDITEPLLVELLANKTKAVALINTDCTETTNTSKSLIRLRGALLTVGVKVDVYGSCVETDDLVVCVNEDCEGMLKNEYHFYIVLEGEFDEHYVTSNVLFAYDNYVVPIIIGNADYSRFLPPGSYITTQEYTFQEVAIAVKYAMTHPEVYKQYFRWRNHYTIEDALSFREDHTLCRLCASLHQDSGGYPAIKEFRKWWMGDQALQRCSSNVTSTV